MPSAAEKLLDSMRNSKAGWSSRELLKLYSGFGFKIRNGRRHDIASHPVYPELRATIPRHARELGKKYISTAVDLIDKLLVLEKEAQGDAGKPKGKS